MGRREGRQIKIILWEDRMEEGAFSLFFVLFSSTSERETAMKSAHGGADDCFLFFFILNMNMIQI